MSRVLQVSFEGVSMKNKECFVGDLRVFQESVKSISKTFVSKVFQEVYQEIFKEISRKCKEV